jgi:hypothetical protein
MFRPNTKAEHWKRSAKPDRRGEYTYERQATGLPCAIVKLGAKTEKTNVRADSSGSRGKATESQGDSVILVPTYYDVGEGDIVKADGQVMEIVGIFLRRNVLGTPDHLEVSLIAAQEPTT